MVLQTRMVDQLGLEQLLGSVMVMELELSVGRPVMVSRLAAYATSVPPPWVEAWTAESRASRLKTWPSARSCQPPRLPSVTWDILSRSRQLLAIVARTQ